MILFDRLARAPIDGRRAGFRCGVRVDSASGPRWWIPTGPWGPPGIHLRIPARCLILRLFQALLGGLRPGWTPKKIALSLAKFRASPPRIHSGPEGPVKSTGWAPKLIWSLNLRLRPTKQIDQRLRLTITLPPLTARATLGPNYTPRGKRKSHPVSHQKLSRLHERG